MKGNEIEKKVCNSVRLLELERLFVLMLWGSCLDSSQLSFVVIMGKFTCSVQIGYYFIRVMFVKFIEWWKLYVVITLVSVCSSVLPVCSPIHQSVCVHRCGSWYNFSSELRSAELTFMYWRSDVKGQGHGVQRLNCDKTHMWIHMLEVELYSGVSLCWCNQVSV